MARLRRGLFWCAAGALCAAMLLTMQVSTRQCVNYRCRRIPMPAYLKALDFFDRHYNYLNLAGVVAPKHIPEETRALLLLKWTQEHIKDNQGQYPVIDDHAWYIIVRGYGTDDQFQDVFTTLCNYAGLQAYFKSIATADSRGCKSMSFVKINGAWRIFDAYRGAYFVNKEGALATLDEFERNAYRMRTMLSAAPRIEYNSLLRMSELKECARPWQLSRAAIQSPFRRMWYWITSGN